MDYQSFAFWFGVVQWLTTVGVWIYVWNVNRNRVTDARISALEDHVDTKIDGHADRIARLEQDARHMPSHADLKSVHRRLDEVNGELKQLSGQFTAANNTLSLIHQHLLEKGS